MAIPHLFERMVMRGFDCYKITNWQFVGEKCKTKMMDAYVDNIIALFNAKEEELEQ